jgi:hypothetical protein
VWTFVYAGVPLAIPFLVARQRAVADAQPEADARLKTLRVLSAIAGAVMIAGAIALFFAPVDLGKHWPWTLTPLLGRAVAAWYALFGTMLVSCAVGLRRPAEAIVPYATLAAWSVLLLALPLLHRDDVSGAGAYIAGMLALLALSAYALRIALPAREEL